MVSAIYEPPQESTRDTVKLLEDENKEKVEEIATALGLVKVQLSRPEYRISLVQWGSE